MSAALALPRLVWRPASIGLLFMTLLATALAFTFDVQLDGSGEEIRRAVLVTRLWRLSVLLPAAVGIALGMITTEAQHTPFAWTLPRLRSELFTGKLLAMLVIAAIVAAVLSAASEPVYGAAAFGVAALFFALGGSLADPLSSRVQYRALLLVAAILVFRPEYLEQVATAQPIPVGVASMAIAVLLLRREFAASTARERPHVAAMPVGTTTALTRRAYFARTKTADGEWSRPLWIGRMTDWLRAGSYETFGGRGRGYMSTLALQFLIVSAMAYYFASPAMVAYMPAMTSSWMAPQLRGRFHYPLSRHDRARLIFWGSLAEILAITLLAVVSLGILYELGPRRGWDHARAATFADALPLVFAVLAWAPVGQWARVGRPFLEEDTASVRQMAVVFGFLMAWVALAILSGEWLARLNPAPRYTLLVALAAITQTAYWHALRWYHARKDIVFLPGV